VAEGLYPENLRRIVERCDRGLKEPGRALGAYVIRSVVGDLLREWEGQAVTVAETRRAGRELGPPLAAVAAALERGDPPARLAPLLDELVRAAVTL
jgi:hypothetical protein